MRKIRKGDEVIVIAGKDKGKIGQILQVIGDEKVVIEGVNVFKKAVKPNPMQNISGGIVDKNMPIHISNVAILNPETKKADRVGFRIEGDQKVRFFKSTNKVVGEVK